MRACVRVCMCVCVCPTILTLTMLLPVGIVYVFYIISCILHDVRKEVVCIISDERKYYNSVIYMCVVLMCV